MDALTREQVSELRQELERQLEKLERSMRLTEQAVEPVPVESGTVGRLSRAEALQSRDLHRTLHERERVKLAALREAVRRMDEGSYGVCLGCGDGIAFGRLYVLPETTTCAACGEAA